MPTRPARRLLLRAASASALGCTLGARATAPPKPLVVWFTVEGAKAMRTMGTAFTAATGVPVVVETPDEGASKFQQAASAGTGPDIYIYAHDRIGEWVGGGLLHAVTPSRALFEENEALAWKGLTYRGRLWGYPFAVEAITLIYNKALVKTPPRTWEDVFALDDTLRPQGKRAILWDYTTPYFTWPLLAANGGYAFKPRADGGFDARDTGVAHPGAVQGAELLARLLREGRMPVGSGYPEMEAAMAQGRVAMMINGPWAWVNLRRVGMDFGVANIPTVNGAPAKPFVGVKALMINRATTQRELAVEFIEHYLLSPEGLRTINAAEPIGAPSSKRYYAELSADPRIAGIMASARDGTPTPSIPEMGRFWSALKSSFTSLSEGRLDAQQALAFAAKRITSP